MIACEGCKKPIEDRTLPGQVILLPHAPPGGRWPVTESRKMLWIDKERISLFCSVRCIRDWCDRILLEIG